MRHAVHMKRRAPGPSGTPARVLACFTRAAQFTKARRSHHPTAATRTLPTPQTTHAHSISAESQVVVLFSGTRRSRALEYALEKEVNHMFPVSAFQRHKKVLFVSDEDATLELRVKTVRDRLATVLKMRA